jgi:hypothetical protein
MIAHHSSYCAFEDKNMAGLPAKAAFRSWGRTVI